MMLDYTSTNELFEFVKARGFAGTQSEWVAEVERQVDASAVRDFCHYAMAVSLDISLKEVFLAGCARVMPKFEHVHTSCGGNTAHISFTDRAAGNGRGLRISQLTIDVRRVQETTLVRLQGYVKAELRLDRTFIAQQEPQP